MVKSALLLLAQNNREVFNVLSIEYGHKNHCFKRRSMIARHVLWLRGMHGLNG
ncbi:hypothetical protein [Snodgrassella gandavensis]|uniref:hypothetical protein n=1 Tax=Snodgrassella gandavensis TaxID=2946698 RepID=UPI001EF3E22C|nr:hypothetical protein [Snodgrassella gandavensis]